MRWVIIEYNFNCFIEICLLLKELKLYFNKKLYFFLCQNNLYSNVISGARYRCLRPLRTKIILKLKNIKSFALIFYYLTFFKWYKMEKDKKYEVNFYCMFYKCGYFSTQTVKLMYWNLNSFTSFHYKKKYFGQFVILNGIIY